MALNFTAASSEMLTVASAPVTAVPLTMACWYKTNGESSYGLMDLHSTAGAEGANSFRLYALAASVTASVNADNASTSTNPADATWNHACGVYASTTSRSAYLNGGGKATNTNSATPASIAEFNIGKIGGASDAFFMNGDIAEAAIWNIALSDAEVALLALGASPLFVRPEALVFYLPMIGLGGGTQLDWFGGRTMTETNTPANAAHPPNIFYPSWLTTGYGVPSVSSTLTGSLHLTGLMSAIPLAANYGVFASDVPKRTFVSR